MQHIQICMDYITRLRIVKHYWLISLAALASNARDLMLVFCSGEGHMSGDRHFVQSVDAFHDPRTVAQKPLPIVFLDLSSVMMELILNRMQVE
jgi:hypothetical protein